MDIYSTKFVWKIDLIQASAAFFLTNVSRAVISKARAKLKFMVEITKKKPVADK